MMKVIMRAILSTLLTFFGIGCSKQDQQSQVQQVDPATLKPGPIQHEELTPEQFDRIARLQRIFSEVDRSPLEKWIDNFKRDMSPDSEIAIWERMADVYVKYTSQRDLSLEAKGDVFQVVLVRSTTSDEEKVLKQLNLKVLNTEEARDVMRLF